MTEKRPHIIKAGEQSEHTFTFRHPLGGDASEITMTALSRGTALSRVGVNLGRVPPGKEAFVFHCHHAEEEWAYILEGKALSDIEGDTQEVGPGDFLAYPAGVGHNLKNIGDKDLVYLMGGEQVSVEIADFPRHGKRVLRAGDRLEFMDESDATAFIPDIQPAKSESD